MSNKGILTVSLDRLIVKNLHIIAKKRNMKVSCLVNEELIGKYGDWRCTITKT